MFETFDSEEIESVKEIEVLPSELIINGVKYKKVD